VNRPASKKSSPQRPRISLPFLISRKSRAKKLEIWPGFLTFRSMNFSAAVRSLGVFCVGALAFLLLAGCASFPSKVNRLEIGQSQRQVERILGRDYVTKAARQEADGSSSRLMEYRDPRSNRPFWVFLRDGSVVQWGTPESLRHLTDLNPAF
jgi:hypothetical protein